mmetsp:Transcript_2625/g.6205  ORF Transcript_2625/g.6205 Transcript_2625/m.6205 type:complete len:870 (+) Transcript_2625:197-2806(+)
MLLYHNYLTILLLLIATSVMATKSEFNYEIGKRVLDLLRDYTDAPSKVLEFLSNYREKNAFPHGLEPQDRDIFFQLGDTLLTANPRLLLFYALENGAFAGNQRSPTFAHYREPGESGYRLDGPVHMEKLQKHLDSCIDENGRQVPCLLGPGESYIECIDNCTSLQRCPDEDSQQDCSAVERAEERSLCESNTKWCISYATRSIPLSDDSPKRGYIPFTFYCIDINGLPTQTPGENAELGADGLGNCYHDDGITPVNRQVSGGYAYCGGEGIICNNTFLGGFTNGNFDPRYRPWYIATKQKQVPNWSEPYEFYTHNIGITFSRPIYSIDEEGKTIFTGVLASDYSLDGIASFLTNNYDGSDTIVTIVEEAEPNYVIASSTGITGVRKVLIEDNSKPCTEENDRDRCMGVRIPISDLNEDIMEQLISTTYLTQKEKNFPVSELIPVRVDHDDFRGVYASHTIGFETKEAGISWRIMILSPVSAHEDDTIMPGDSMFQVLITSVSAGFLVCSTLLVHFIRNRREKEIIASDWRFTGVFLVGCALLNLACLSYIGQNTNATCLARMWVIHFFFVFALTPLFVKTYRLYKLTGVGSIIPRRQTISNARTVLMAMPFLAVEVLILLVFTFIDPNKVEDLLVYDESHTENHVECKQDTWAFFALQLLYEGGLVFVGCLLAYKTRNMRKEYRDNQQLLLTMYNIALVGSVIIVVLNAAERFQATTRVFITIGILWVTVFSSCVFVVPKLLLIRSRKLNPVEEDEPARRTLSIVGNIPDSIQRMGRRISHRYSQNSIHFWDQTDEYEDNIGSSGRSTQTASVKLPMFPIQENRNCSEEVSQNFSSEEQLNERTGSLDSTAPEKSSTSGSISKSSCSSS